MPSKSPTNGNDRGIRVPALSSRLPDRDDLPSNTVDCNGHGQISDLSNIGERNRTEVGYPSKSTYTFADLGRFGAAAATEMSSFTTWQGPSPVDSAGSSTVPDSTSSSNDENVTNGYEQRQYTSAQNNAQAELFQQSLTNQDISLLALLGEASQGMVPGLSYDSTYPPIPMDQDMAVIGVDWKEPGLRTVIEGLAQPYQVSPDGGLFVGRSEAQGNISTTPSDAIHMHNISSNIPANLNQSVPLPAELSSWEEQLFGTQIQTNDAMTSIAQQAASATSLGSAFGETFVLNVNRDELGPTSFESGTGVDTIIGASGFPTSMSSFAPATGGAMNASQSDAMLLQAWRALSEIPEFTEFNFGSGMDLTMDSATDPFA